MKIDLQLDYQTILANQARPVHFALQFKAENVTVPRPKPAAFCVVMDHSGSMAGAPLEHAKKAACVAIRNLRQGDQFALVLFESTARVLIPLQTCSTKQRLMDEVNKINPAGSTNLTGGWILGRDELKKAPADASRRLLLLSDGLLNAGITEPAAVRQIVASGLETGGIRTSSLGFGDNYDENLLTALATVTNGQFYDADSPEKLPEIFAHELDGLQKLAVQTLRIRLQRLEFCESFELLSDYPMVDLPDGRREFAIGDLVSDEERVLCFQLEVLPLPWLQGAPVVSLAGEQLLKLEILYDEIGADGLVSRSHEQVVRVQPTQNPEEVKVNETVVGWVALQKAGQTIKRATDALASGSPQNAQAILEAAVKLLSGCGAKEKVAPAIQMLNELLADVQHGSLSPRDLKLHSSRGYFSRHSSSRSYRPPFPPPQPGAPPSDPHSKGNGPKA